jgi:hypothetical protein
MLNKMTNPFNSLTPHQIASLLEPNASCTKGSIAYDVLIDQAVQSASMCEAYQSLAKQLATEGEPTGELYALNTLTTFYAGREQRNEGEDNIKALIDLLECVWNENAFNMQRHLAGLLQMFGVSLVRDRSGLLKEKSELAELCETTRKADGLFIACCQARDGEAMAALAEANPSHASKWQLLAGEIGDEMNAESGSRWYAPHVSNALKHGFWPSTLFERPASVEDALSQAADKQTQFMTGDMFDHLLAGFIRAAGIDVASDAARTTSEWRVLNKAFDSKELEHCINKAPLKFRGEWLAEHLCL